MEIFESKKLYNLDRYFNHFIELHQLKKFPKILMLSGKKGSGKFTLVFHILNYIFDKKNYDLKNKEIQNDTSFTTQLKNKVFSNILFLSNNLENIKIDEIRKLKSTLLKSTINNLPRFVILDGVELFNINSLNSLLKLIEEPSINNYFILINNEEKKLLETVKSRCINHKIYINNKDRFEIIASLSKSFNIKQNIDYKSIDITPGNYLKYSRLCDEHEINFNDNYYSNISKLFFLYKKNKNLDYISICSYMTDIYFYKLCSNNKKYIEKYNSIRFYILKNLSDLTVYNLNINSVLNSISNKIKYV